jgi:primosomal protein N' (replication factor Y) (superfamily II helicase)
MPAADTVLRVALPLPLPRLFDYHAAGNAAASPQDIGRRVQVPFGPRELVGVVIATGAPEPDAPELREVLSWPDDVPLFHGELLDSLHWLARYTHAPVGEVFATALPAALRRGEPLPDTHAWAWRLTESGATAFDRLRPGKPREFAELLRAADRDETVLDDLQPGWRSAARALAKRGYVERVAVMGAGGWRLEAEDRRDATSSEAPVPSLQSPAPNPEQQSAIAALRTTQGFAPLLLDGVTGSGKTEVYLHAIADCLARGRQALVLVPEIGLTPQLLARFRARLGVPVHATHSGLNDNERARAWTAAWRGEARVIVGTRSAVFTPLPDAGLIVVDEEHDGSYKQQDGIRYQARDFALVRGKALDVPVILGSATPSLESLHNARAGRYAHLRLTKRAGAAQPPSVRVLDVRKRPLQAGLSPELLQSMRAALDAGGQVLVFKNRRGYAPVLLCHDCGWSAHCKRCDAAMTVHAYGRRLQCHHCGARQSAPLSCPDCASLALQPQGVGTERLEALLGEQFGDVPVLRIDRGSTRRKDALEKHLDGFGTRPGILVGTQMLAKGHDLPNLTLVCVVGIDEGLFSADFRAGEKLAQLLIQVAGRAGRADRRGEVLLQTHHPEHPLLQTLIHGGYHAFADTELVQREAADFPPFVHLALLRAEAKHADAPMQFLHAAKDAFALDASKGENLAVEISSPLPAPMPRRAGMYRVQLLLSASNRRALHATLEAVVPGLYAAPEARKVRWSLDVDPVDLY